jgi:hypothetical protein
LVLVNVAVTFLADDIVKVQVDVLPLHVPPDQPVNVYPAAGDAVSVTDVTFDRVLWNHEHVGLVQEVLAIFVLTSPDPTLVNVRS